MRMHERSGYTIIDMPSVVSHASVEQITLRLWGWIGKLNHKYVVNMENLSSLQAPHVRILAHIFQLVSQVYGNLCIVNAADNVKTAIQFAKIDREIPVYDTLMEFELNKTGRTVTLKATGTC